MIATPFRLASATLLMLASLGATAQSKDIVVDGQGEVPYVVDQRNVVTRSGFDLCWRTGYWTPAAAGAVKAGELPVGCHCDKDVVGADTCVPATARGAAGAPAAAAVAAPAAAAKCDFSVNLSADSTFAFACNAYNELTVASGFDVNIIASARLGDTLIATATEVAKTRRTGVCGAAQSRYQPRCLRAWRTPTSVP